MRAKLKPLGLPEGIARSTTNISKLRASTMFKATMVSLATSTSKPARMRWASTVRAKVGSSSTTITLCMAQPPVLLGGLNRLPCSRLFVDAVIPQPQLETREHWRYFELSPRLCRRIRVRSRFDVVGDQDFAVGAKVAAAIASHWAPAPSIPPTHVGTLLQSAQHVMGRDAPKGAKRPAGGEDAGPLSSAISISTVQCSGSAQFHITMKTRCWRNYPD